MQKHPRLMVFLLHQQLHPSCVNPNHSSLPKTPKFSCLVPGLIVPVLHNSLSALPAFVPAFPGGTWGDGSCCHVQGVLQGPGWGMVTSWGHRSCSRNSPLITALLKGCLWNTEFADQSHPPLPNPLPGGKHGAGRQQEGPDSTQPRSVAVEATSSQAPVSLCTKLPHGANPARAWSTSEPLAGIYTHS